LKFLQVCGCKGTIWTGVSQTSPTKITSNLFKGFSINVSKDEGLSVIAVDSFLRKSYAWITLYDVDIIEEGELDISDLDPIIDTLSIIPSTKIISVKNEEGDKIVIESEDEKEIIEYTIKQQVNTKDLLLSKQKAVEYKKGYSLDETGMPVLETKGEKYPFKTFIKLPLSTIHRIFTGAIKLVDGDWITITLSKNGIQFDLGRANSSRKGKEFIKGTFENPLDISRKFNLVQTVFKNILSDATLYFRVNKRGKLIMWVKSEHEGILQNYNIGQKSD